MRARHLAPLAVGLLVTACGSAEPPDEVRCWDGFAAADAGRCQPVIPAASCGPAGLRAFGETECRPVGPVCGAGLVVDALGVGCQPVLPPAPCTGATREVAGSESCQPVGDCSASFPPAEATVHVDPAFTDAELDAAHHRTLQGALDAAAAGAVVSVAPGTYAETLTIRRAVTLRGKCAAEVELADTGGNALGVRVNGPHTVTLAGMTLRGFFPAIAAGTGAQVVVRDAVVADSVGYGLVAVDAGTRLTVERSVIRGGRAGGGEEWGAGAAANAQAHLEIVDSTLADNVGVGVYLSGVSSSGRIADSLVLRTALDDLRQNDAGLYMHAGVSVVVERTVFDESAGLGIVAFDAGTRLELHDSVIRRSHPDRNGISGLGVGVWEGASAAIRGTTVSDTLTAGIHVRNAAATVSDSAILRTSESPGGYDVVGLGTVVYPGMGLIATFDADVVVERVVISEATGTAITAGASRLEATDLLVRDTLAADDSGFGLGAVIYGGGTGTFTNLEVVRATGGGLLVTDLGSEAVATGVVVEESSIEGGDDVGIGEGLTVQLSGRLEASRVLVRSTQGIGLVAGALGAVLRVTTARIESTEEHAIDGSYGHALGVATGGTAHLRNVELVGSRRIGAAYDGGGGSLVGCRIAGNATGLQWDSGTVVREVETVPATVEPGELIVDSDTVFEENGQKVGSGALVLPDPKEAYRL